MQTSSPEAKGKTPVWVAPWGLEDPVLPAEDRRIPVRGGSGPRSKVRKREGVAVGAR